MKKIICNNNYANHLEIVNYKLKKLIDDLCQYFSLISIHACLKNKHELEFDNLDELLNFDNYNNERIDTITFRLRKGNNDSLRLYISSRGLFSYDLELSENFVFEKEIIEKLDSFRKNSTAFNKLIPLFISFIFCSLFLLFVFKFVFKISLINLHFNLNTICFVLFLEIVVLIIFDKIENYFLPNILFLWGDECRRIERMKKIRYWIVEVITAIIIGIVLKYL